MKQALLLIAVFVIAMNWSRISMLWMGDIDYDPAVSGAVTLYSTQSCGYCASTRAFLRRHDIPFEERDVENSEAAMQQMALMNAYAVPVTIIGDEVIHGYRPSALARALDAN
ncbi:MAG: glutaredoxin family protein [Gammaproteobacteria bacterium]|nr:glutaredoxin family protein [Gammaproteobacteria bacterium]